MAVKSLHSLRQEIRHHYITDEAAAVERLINSLDLPDAALAAISAAAAGLVRELRRADSPGVMETFLSEYGLSTDEGVALMCLAEALLRVPDDTTVDALISDKIAPADWSRHLGRSEEHTSELQSRENLVCRLLLEKKKKTQ